MTICTDCNQEMRDAASCTVETLHLDGVTYPVVRHRGKRRCGDCGVLSGGAHHLGCDVARCPRRRRQLLSCGAMVASSPSASNAATTTPRARGALPAVAASAPANVGEVAFPRWPTRRRATTG